MAEFDERLPTYFMLRTLLAFLLTLFLAPLIPLWLVLGKQFHRKEYEAKARDAAALALVAAAGAAGFAGFELGKIGGGSIVSSSHCESMDMRAAAA